MLYTRMLFSCLVDADYTVSSEAPVQEGAALDISAGLRNLEAYRKKIGKNSQADPVLNQFRSRLFELCRRGSRPEGCLP